VALKSNGGKIFTSSAVNDKNILECQGPRVFINSHDTENTGETLVACFITFTILAATISLSPIRNPLNSRSPSEQTDKLGKTMCSDQKLMHVILPIWFSHKKAACKTLEMHEIILYQFNAAVTVCS
jgi:hypothetical protein